MFRNLCWYVKIEIVHRLFGFTTCENYRGEKCRDSKLCIAYQCVPGLGDKINKVSFSHASLLTSLSSSFPLLILFL